MGQELLARQSGSSVPAQAVGSAIPRATGHNLSCCFLSLWLKSAMLFGSDQTPCQVGNGRGRRLAALLLNGVVFLGLMLSILIFSPCPLEHLFLHQGHFLKHYQALAAIMSCQRDLLQSLKPYRRCRRPCLEVIAKHQMLHFWRSVSAHTSPSHSWSNSSVVPLWTSFPAFQACSFLLGLCPSALIPSGVLI